MEPFGWPDNEYRTAALLSQLANVNIAKKKNKTEVKDYMRDMSKLIERAIQQEVSEEKMRERFMAASPEEKAHMIGAFFGKNAKVEV